MSKYYNILPTTASFFMSSAGKIEGVEEFEPAALLNTRLWHRCFPVNFAKLLRTPFLTEHL